MSRRRVCLSVGAGSCRGLPRTYRDFEVVTLDVDPATRPDIVADARDLGALASETFDAIYVPHLLEVFERHEVTVVMNEFERLLRVGGFVEVRVAHVRAVFEAVVEGADLDEPLYDSALGPITALDVLFGHGQSLAQGKHRMAHRVAFTPALLEKVLKGPGLVVELIQPTEGKRFELCGIARKVGADAGLRKMRAEEPLGSYDQSFTM